MVFHWLCAFEGESLFQPSVTGFSGERLSPESGSEHVAQWSSLSAFWKSTVMKSLCCNLSQSQHQQRLWGCCEDYGSWRSCRWHSWLGLLGSLQVKAPGMLLFSFFAHGRKFSLRRSLLLPDLAHWHSEQQWNWGPKIRHTQLPRHLGPWVQRHYCQHLRYTGAQVSCGTGVWIPGACSSDLGPGVMRHSSDLDSVCPEDGELKSQLWPL